MTTQLEYVQGRKAEILGELNRLNEFERFLLDFDKKHGTAGVSEKQHRSPRSAKGNGPAKHKNGDVPSYAEAVMTVFVQSSEHLTKDDLIKEVGYIIRDPHANVISRYLNKMVHLGRVVAYENETYGLAMEADPTVTVEPDYGEPQAAE